MVLPAENSANKDQEEPEELARFREEWRAELARRKALESAKGKQPETVESGLNQGERSTRAQRPHARKASVGDASTATGRLVHPAIQDGKVTSAAASPVLNSALGAYRRAVHHEQKGELDAALGLYRQAFRLVRLLHLTR